MSYLAFGEHHTIVFLANPRTASTTIGEVLVGLGGWQQGGHHDDAQVIPENALIVQTVRHHCDVLASYWFKGQQGVSLETFVETVLTGQHGWFRDTGFYNHWDCEPNYTLRYETLDKDWFNLCSYAGLYHIRLPRTRTHRPLNLTWQELFPVSLRDKVMTHYKTEMEEYGYGCN